MIKMNVSEYNRIVSYIVIEIQIVINLIYRNMEIYFIERIIQFIELLMLITFLRDRYRSPKESSNYHCDKIRLCDKIGEISNAFNFFIHLSYL